MKLITFKIDKGYRLGIVLEQGILHIKRAYELFPTPYKIPLTIDEVIRSGRGGILQLQLYLEERGAVLEPALSLWFEEEDIVVGPCIPLPQKVICVGTNYRKHAEESNMPIPTTPLLFSKFANTIAAHNDKIPLTALTKQVDYEAELGIVIGQITKNVTKAEALDYVLGYCNANDLSARDLQFKTSQWLLGKSLDKFSPVGPYLVTADEIEDPNQLTIRCTVNGELRQQSNTSDMVFNCQEIISYVSEHMTLMPGDIILTGTPEGVVFNGFDGQQSLKKDHLEWLKDGDIVTIEIEKLGRLTNVIESSSYR